MKDTRRPIGWQELFIFACLSALSAWTVSYHLVLAARWPAFSIPALFAVLIGAQFLFLNRRTSWPKRLQFDRWTLLLLATSLLVAGLSMITLRPDADDVEFFHRAYLQSFHWLEPVYVHETSYNDPNLPPLSMLHLTTSYEYLVIAIAAVLHMDPVLVYQNIMGALFSFLVPILYFIIASALKIRREKAVLVALFAVAFLLLDGNTHRSFGNMAIVRLWQGKTILWTVLIPLSMIVTYRYLTAPSRLALLCVGMSGVAAIGFSNAAIYQTPLLAFCLSLAYLAHQHFAKEVTLRTALTRVVFVGLAHVYTIGFALGVLTGAIPSPQNTGPWVNGWPQHWWDNLRYVIATNRELLRDILLLFVLPFVVLPKKQARLLVFYALVLVVVCFNPLTGPYWLQMVMPGSYWRFLYLLPLPLCFGLLACCLPSRRTFRRKQAVGLLVLLSTLFAVQHTVLSPQQILYKQPLDYKFDRTLLSFTQGVRERVEGRNVLATKEITTVLPLLSPTVRLEAARTGPAYYFGEAGRPEEGERRTLALLYVMGGTDTSEAEAAFLESIRRGVDAVILSNKMTPAITASLARHNVNSDTAYQDDSYTLLLLNP